MTPAQMAEMERNQDEMLNYSGSNHFTRGNKQEQRNDFQLKLKVDDWK